MYCSALMGGTHVPVSQGASAMSLKNALTTDGTVAVSQGVSAISLKTALPTDGTDLATPPPDEKNPWNQRDNLPATDYRITLEPDQTNTTAANTSSTTTSGKSLCSKDPNTVH
ncbi:UNVERIFIED_CONTAM: hypothetical protein FKN15_059938 [Acipenser sinensis]